MMRIGLTGGIGSGKSVVASVFEHLGVAVYYSDDRAKVLMAESEDLRSAIVNAFGREAYLPSGGLNKEFLRRIVFAHAEGRVLLNSLVHPAVSDDFVQWFEVQQTCTVLFESALLLQTASRALMDRILVVTAPEEIRIARVMQRDGITREATLARMNVQMTQDAMTAQADDIIDNSGTHIIIPQVLTLITYYNNGKVH